MDLSVVVPVRNEEAHLGDQLDALLSQTWHRPFEVIVVDNRSNDGTAALVEARALDDERLRIVRADDRSGTAYGRNVGARAAKSDAVAFCDGDDIVVAGWVAAMGEALDRHEFVTGPVELDRLNPSWLAGSRGRADERSLPTYHGIFPRALGNNLGIRRATLERLHGFDEELPVTADVDLSMRAWMAGIVLGYEPAARMHYRYRTQPAALWRQGLAYGRERPRLRRELRRAGRPAPGRFAGWRSWAWLVVHLPSLRSPQGRALLAWVAGNRFGQLQGSVRYRTLEL